MAEDAARELPKLPLEDAPPARSPLRRARIAEVRACGDALDRALSGWAVAATRALRERRCEPC